MLAHFSRMNLRRIGNEASERNDEHKSAKGNGADWSTYYDGMFSFEGVGQRRWQHNPRSRSLAHGNMGDILSSYYTPIVVLNLNCQQCVPVGHIDILKSIDTNYLD